MKRKVSHVIGGRVGLLNSLYAAVLIVVISLAVLPFFSQQASAAYTNKADCEANGGEWKIGIKPGTGGQRSEYCDEGTTITNEADCKASGGTWSEGKTGPSGATTDQCVPGSSGSGSTQNQTTCRTNGGTWNAASSKCDYNNASFQEKCKQAGVADANLSQCALGAQNKSDLSYCTTTYSGNKDNREACYKGQGSDAIPECLDLGYSIDNGTLAACVSGSQNKTNEDYCSLTFSNGANSGLKISACNQGRQVSVTPTNIIGQDATCADNPDAEGCDVASSCGIEAIGWILCPVMNFIGLITDGSYEVVEDLLTTPPSMFNTNASEGKATYEAWSVMRSIANVAFVLFFLVIIFSQLTSLGISNYGVKKLVPKLVVAAILVNASFIVTALAVDASNVIGQSLKGFFDTIESNLTIAVPDSPLSAALNGTNVWSNVIGGVLAGSAIIGAALYAGLSVLIPLAVAALAAILTVVVVLTLRQALIILLIVISPLAFVALLLPNTEGWFKAWRGLLFTLLAMFPIIAAIFGAAALAGKIVMMSSPLIHVQIMGAGITIIPLLITPVVMKAAGGILNKFAGVLNDKDKGVFDGMKKRAGDFRDRRQNIRAANAMTGRPVFGGGQFRRKEFRRLKDEEADSRAKAAAAGFGISDNQAADVTTQIAENQLASNIASTAKNSMITSGIANNTLQPSTVLGEGAAMDPQVQRAVAQLQGKAMADEIASELRVLVQEIAKEKAKPGGKSMDAVLFDQAKGGATQASRSAAMHHMAAMGRDGKITELMGNDAAGNPHLDEKGQTAMQEAIGANASGLLAKAPHLVKGEEAAFKTMTGAQMSKYSTGTAQANIKYMEGLHAKAFDMSISATDRNKAAADLSEAMTAFNGSLQDIKNDTALQADFTGATGIGVHQALGASSASFQQFASTNLNVSHIDTTTGKIR